MSAFVDTSAFYALLVSTDDAHQAVRVAVDASSTSAGPSGPRPS